MCLCCINIQIVGSMLTSIRKLKLGREKIEGVLEIAKKNNNNNNLSLNETPIYLDLFILYNDLDDMQASMELSFQIHFVDNDYKMAN